MKQYFGTREFERAEAFVRTDGGDARPLAPRNDFMNHSPDGFEWGYGGSGPAQLALALLADALGDEPALALYQDFKFAFVAGWRDQWQITDDEIRTWHRQRVTGQATRSRAARHAG